MQVINEHRRIVEVPDFWDERQLQMLHLTPLSPGGKAVLQAEPEPPPPSPPGSHHIDGEAAQARKATSPKKRKRKASVKPKKIEVEAETEIEQPTDIRTGRGR